MSPMRAMPRLKTRDRLLLLVVSFLACLFLYCWTAPTAALTAFVARSRPLKPVCPESARAGEVLVVLRTGATEALEKLPIHFKTTLACVPDYVIYSDFEEEIEGHQIQNVLTGVNGGLKESISEFSLYNHLQERGRKGLKYQTTFGSGPDGESENLGWKLDKWKFLPMIERALRHRPEAKWFVFIEADTYMMWQNMLEYLAKFDASEPHYLGKHMQIGEILFGHGGSGFVLSQPAMGRFSRYWSTHKEELEGLTARQWAGDAILGKAIQDAGIDMFWSYPHLQGDSLTSIDWNTSKIDREPWCYAPTTFHHMRADEFRMLWEFEQAWLRENQGNSNHGAASPRFRDVFRRVIFPLLKSQRDDWDNISTGREYSEEATAKLSRRVRKRLSSRERGAHLSFKNCQAVCANKPGCLQFSYTPGRCSVSTKLRLGRPATSQCLEYSDPAGKCIREMPPNATLSAGSTAKKSKSVQSGWILSRVVDYMDTLNETCVNLVGRDWVT